MTSLTGTHTHPPDCPQSVTYYLSLTSGDLTLFASLYSDESSLSLTGSLCDLGTTPIIGHHGKSSSARWCRFVKNAWVICLPPPWPHPCLVCAWMLSMNDLSMTLKSLSWPIMSVIAWPLFIQACMDIYTAYFQLYLICVSNSGLKLRSPVHTQSTFNINLTINMSVELRGGEIKFWYLCH